jgi:type IV secretory pathway VirD2 relaxase
MQAIEQALGVKLDWIGAVHHDTNTPHAQFLWSGRTLAGEPVRIDRE